jgi:hypothetical protein
MGSTLVLAVALQAVLNRWGMVAMGCGSLWKWRDKSISRHGNMCIYICIYIYIYTHVKHKKIHENFMKAI